MIVSTQHQSSAPTALSLCIVILTLLFAGAYAGLDEFESWRLDLQDADDEYALDHLLFDYDRRWEEAWWIARNGVRMANGCGTHEKWELHTQVKLERELGARFRFNYRFEQEERFSHRREFNQISLAWRQTDGFLAGLLYRPRFSKAEHDLGYFVGVERDSLEAIYLSLTHERWLNNGISGKHSLFEEARWRYESLPRFLELSGHWRLGQTGLAAFDLGVLSPTDRLFKPPAYSNSVEPTYRQHLRGDRGRLRLWTPRWGAWSGRVELGWKRGRDALAPLAADSVESATPRDICRRERWLRPGLEWQLSRTLRAELIGEYREKREENETATAPKGFYLYRSSSRIYLVGLVWDPTQCLEVDLGYAHNNVSIQDSADPGWILSGARHGSRQENRLVISIDVHWHGISVLFRETLELDDENYDSFLFHDKTFIQIMATL